jgi:putative acetyltransferase
MPNAECRMTKADGPAIRQETPADCAGVYAVHRAAFGRDDEPRLVDRLRRTESVIASLVAVQPAGIVGHVLFTPVFIESRGATVTIASLAPLAVLPACQGTGIGTALVRAGLETCQSAGYRGIVVVGGPGYYARFGFDAATVAHLDSPYAGAAFMGLDVERGFLAGITGTVRYPRAFAEL